MRAWTATAGDAELEAFLADTDILAVLLPLTPETRGLLDRALIRQAVAPGRDERLPGPVLINAGRGGLQVDADILAALEAGELYAASLDVFETEPLPHRARCGRIRASSSRRTTPPKARPRPSCAMPYASGSDIWTACRSRTSWIASAAIEARGRTSTAPSVLTHQLSS